MPSKTLSFKGSGWFNPTLFWKNFTRFWPLWAVYTGVLFLLFPAELFELGRRTLGAQEVIRDVKWEMWAAIDAAVPLGVFYGLLVAMALFSYLMSPRSSQSLHALPIRREGLFLTNLLSGACFLLGPQLVNFLLAIPAEAALGALDLRGLVLWLGVSFSAGMLFFSFAVCCAMFTGHILALPVFYGVLNVLVMGMSSLGDNALRTLLTGFSGDALMELPLVRWCTPAWHLSQLLSQETLEGAAWAVGYSAVLTAAFSVLALGVYQRLQAERAGDVVTVGWVRPVFQYGVGVCTGMLLGTVVYDQAFSGRGPWGFILLVSGFAVLGAFAGRMLLKKTMRVFADGWKGPVILGACMLLLLGGARMDLFGYQRRVPDPAQVASVSLSGVRSEPSDSGRYLNYTIKDADGIRAVTQLHAAMVEDLERLEYASSWVILVDLEGNAWGTVGVTLSYTLKDGSVMERQYRNVIIREEDLETPGTYAAQLQDLLNRPEMMEQAVTGRLPGDGELAAVYAAYVTGPSGETMAELEKAEARELWEAMEEDTRAGRLRRYLLWDEEAEDNCLGGEIQFLAVVTYPGGADGQDQSDVWNLRLTPQKSASSLMAKLEELGLLEMLEETAEPKADGPAVTTWETK